MSELNIAQSILDLVDNKTNIMAQELKKAAEESIIIVQKPEEIDDLSDPLRERMKELLDAEAEKNLAWISRSSWNKIPMHIRAILEEYVYPMKWDHYYFELSRFQEWQDMWNMQWNRYEIIIVQFKYSEVRVLG